MFKIIIMFSLFPLILVADILDYYSMAILPSIVANKSIGSESLRITIKKNRDGINIFSIKNRGVDLHSDAQTNLLNLTIHNHQTGVDTEVGASEGWNSVTVETTDNSAIISLSSPKNSALPPTLHLIISIVIQGNNSAWDLSVTGLGSSHSLMTVIYPILNIKSQDNDNFFVPYYHGKVFENTKINPFNYTTRYPRGWGGTMQYMAYYNDEYGLYFGMHDPKASLKNFSAQTIDGGIEVTQTTPVADRTLSDNSWELPGYFALELFKGDWYEAAQKYREWVFNFAEYRPIDTPQRLARQEKIGNISIWVQESVQSYTMDQLEEHIRTFKEYMDIPVGVAWTSFNGEEFDTLYPEIFPEKEGLKDVITSLKNLYRDEIYISGYMNGMLYDMDNLVSYASHEVSAIKDVEGDVLTQTFNNTLFATMCPSQKPWQDIMSSSTQEMTYDIGFDGVYIDMVTASSAKECYDETHNHTLGGGSYWRDGYKQMFHNMHEASTTGTPYVSEEANDFLIDEVDGFLTIGYSTHNQVPALSAVYAGKVQLVGLPMGWSDYKGSDDPDSQRFYGRMAQSFNYGVQSGRFWMGLVSSTHERTRRAAEFVRELGRLRVKLKEFISHGKMLKPLVLSGDIDTVTFPPYDYPGIYQENVVLPAIQRSTWSDGKAIALIFVNAKVPQGENDSISFSFSFDGANYGMEGDTVKIREIRQNSNTEDEDIGTQFTKNITLESYETKVFIVTP